MTTERKERIWNDVVRQIDPPRRPGENPLVPAPRWQPPRRSSLAAAAVVLVLLLAGGLVVIQRVQTGPDHVTASRPGTGPVPSLDALAARVATQPEVPLGDGDHRYLYWVVEHTWEAPDAGGPPARWREELWVSPEGTGRSRVTVLGNPPPEAGLVTEQDRTVDQAGALRLTGFTPAELDQLPVEPEAVLQALEPAAGPLEGTGPAVSVIGALSVPTTPVAVRAALVGALSLLGFGVVDWAHDPLARAGVAVIGPGAPEDRVELILDPETVRPLSVTYGTAESRLSQRRTTIYRVAGTRPDLTS